MKVGFSGDCCYSSGMALGQMRSGASLSQMVQFVLNLENPTTIVRPDMAVPREVIEELRAEAEVFRARVGDVLAGRSPRDVPERPVEPAVPAQPPDRNGRMRAEPAEPAGPARDRMQGASLDGFTDFLKENLDVLVPLATAGLGEIGVTIPEKLASSLTTMAERLSEKARGEAGIQTDPDQPPPLDPRVVAGAGKGMALALAAAQIRGDTVRQQALTQAVQKLPPEIQKAVADQIDSAIQEVTAVGVDRFAESMATGVGQIAALESLMVGAGVPTEEIKIIGGAAREILGSIQSDIATVVAEAGQNDVLASMTLAGLGKAAVTAMNENPVPTGSAGFPVVPVAVGAGALALIGGAAAVL